MDEWAVYWPGVVGALITSIAVGLAPDNQIMPQCSGQRKKLKGPDRH